jgi:hypothetical protein
VERTPLQSKAIVSAGYDAEQRALELEFASGRVYRYEDVPHGTYEWLLRAPSKGGYFARMINDRYAYRDVTGGTDPTESDLAAALQNSLKPPPT